MDGPRDCLVVLSEVSQTERDKYHMISLICGTYLQNRNRVPGVENKLMVSGAEWERGGINWETGIDMYTLLHVK